MVRFPCFSDLACLKENQFWRGEDYSWKESRATTWTTRAASYLSRWCRNLSNTGRSPHLPTWDMTSALQPHHRALVAGSGDRAGSTTPLPAKYPVGIPPNCSYQMGNSFLTTVKSWRQYHALDRNLWGFVHQTVDIRIHREPDPK